MIEIVVAFLAKSLCHAAIHVATHEGFEHLKVHRDFRAFRNHDVLHAVRESYVVALRLIEDAYGRTEPGRKDLLLASACFKRLEVAGLDLLDGPHGVDIGAVETRLEPMLEGHSAKLAKEIARVAEPAPSALLEMLAKDFPNALLYAFREIGIKRRPKVRAVLVQASLSAIELDVKEVEDKLAQHGQRFDAFSARVLDALQRSEAAESERRMDLRRVEEVVADARELLEAQAALIGGLRASGLGKGDPLALLLVSDQNGRPLARTLVSGDSVTLGRGPKNDVDLLDARVSRSHARLSRAGKFFELESIGRAGTSLNGKPVVKTEVVECGDEIGIGPFVVTPYPATLRFDELPEAVTARTPRAEDPTHDALDGRAP